MMLSTAASSSSFASTRPRHRRQMCFVDPNTSVDDIERAFSDVVLRSFDEPPASPSRTIDSPPPRSLSLIANGIIPILADRSDAAAGASGIVGPLGPVRGIQVCCAAPHRPPGARPTSKAAAAAQQLATAFERAAYATAEQAPTDVAFECRDRRPNNPIASLLEAATAVEMVDLAATGDNECDDDILPAAVPEMPFLETPPRSKRYWSSNPEIVPLSRRPTKTFPKVYPSAKGSSGVSSISSASITSHPTGDEFAAKEGPSPIPLEIVVGTEDKDWTFSTPTRAAKKIRFD